MGVKKVMKIILLGILAIILVVLIFLLVISTGKVKPYRDENGNILENSLSERCYIDINGYKNGLFINSKNLNNPVLLFISSGPGTDDYFFNEKYPDMHLEDEYTVVYWDYRGMGICYDPALDPNTITMDAIVEDAAALTDHLRERFNKDKIYIMGFSGGTHIGIRAAKQYPDKYIAYIGMAQIISKGSENDTYIYNFMKDVFTKRGDTGRLNKLERMVDHLENDEVKCKNWFQFIYLLHEAGGGTTLNETEFWGIDVPIMLSHCYTLMEKFDYIAGMKMYRKTPLYVTSEQADYMTDIPSLEIPAYFISGEFDYNCPWPMVEKYYNSLQAPDKYFYKISNAAHSPLWENVPESHKAMCDIKSRTQ